MLSEPIHFTHLKQMARSPAHYRASVLIGRNTPSMRFGRLIHYRILGGAYAIYEGERRGNAWADFAEANAGKDIFTRKEVDAVEPIARAVLDHPLAADLLVGEHEIEVSWKKMGRECSSRLDVLNRKLRRYTELKSARTTEPDRFAFASRRLSYHAQGAWYQDAAEYIGSPVDDVYAVSVETEPPYAVTCFHYQPRLLEVGRKQNHLWLERVLQCEAANDWPAYTQSIVELDVPEEDAFQLNWGDDGEEAAE